LCICWYVINSFLLLTDNGQGLNEAGHVVTTTFQRLLWPQPECLILGNYLVIGSFILPNLLSLFRCLVYTKVSIQVRCSSCFVTKPIFTVRSCQHLAQLPSWRTTPCRLSATAYSIYRIFSNLIHTFFYGFRGLKNQMRIRIACGLESRSRAGFWKNDRAAVHAVRIIQ
jgi:hypothetical protein